MRVTILAVGSRGDVQPYIALGLGLTRAGHDVTVATHDTFRDWVRERGLGYRPIAGDPRAILSSADRWLASGRVRHLVPAARTFVRMLRPLLPALLADYWRAAQGADVLVYSAVAAPAWSVAERLDIPGIAAFLQPLHRTRLFPAIGVPGAVRLGGDFNEWTHAAAAQLAWQPHRRQINAWRRGALGLPPAPWTGPFGRPHGDRAAIPTLYGYSSVVVPRPPDWGPDVHVTGYWVLAPASDWRPTPALEAFLAAGPPPVYVGFGSMTPRDAAPLTALAVGALARAGRRGVLLAGWGELGAGPLPPTVIAVRDVPHEWLFPRVAAVVHHGGAGTTGAALRAGVPSVVVPLGFDQPYWAGRVAALGAGPRPIARRRVTAERLAAAITEATEDPGIRRRAAAIGSALRAEHGVAVAVAAIERYAGAGERGTLRAPGGS